MDSTSSSKTSAGGVIFKRDEDGIKILLIKDNWGRWTFAKGFVEQNETYRVTAIREISEELGIDATKLKYTSDLGQIEYDYVWKGKPVHKKVYYYLYEWVTPQEFHLQKKEGIHDVRWVKVEWLEEEIGYKDDTYLLVEKIAQKFGYQSSVTKK